MRLSVSIFSVSGASFGMKAVFFLLFHLLLLSLSEAQSPGFVSIDCGGTEQYVDDIGLEWTPDKQFPFGKTALISVPNEDRKQYTTVRYFPADNRKYCYTLNVTTRTRYLLRATFLYGNFDMSNVYPSFDISIGPTPWSTIVISDASTIESEESVLLAASPTISVCLSNATTGQPFISTLELRQFNGSLYYTVFESHFFLSLSARINFGAESNDSVRYPDDPFDRIWESDSVKKANYLVDIAPGTKMISTSKPIYVGHNEIPPQKVMQTAVVGTNGSLTYRLNLGGFPGNGWAASYFAEIEDLSPNETRKFKLFIPGMPEISKATVDVQENAQGSYRLYEPFYTNITLPFVFSFEFKKTNDSSKGPILNALEIYNYVEIKDGSQDASLLASFASHYPLADWAQEGGDPCQPASWSWVQCSQDSEPRILMINLSGKNLTGNIPLELTKLTNLVDLRLDGNELTGTIPDFSGCLNLEHIHLENNQLTGAVPSSLVDAPSLKELYLQNNMLSGSIPVGLLNKNIIFEYSGNVNLHGASSDKSHLIIIIVCSVFGVLLFIAGFCAFRFCAARNKRKNFHKDNHTNARPTQKLRSFFSEIATESAYKFQLAEIEDATGKFKQKIGSGGFGIVYYGKLKDGKEIAVKVLTNESFQGYREFSNEVSLLSRIHHRNLVTFLGYSQQDGKNILVYEFMHNGTLKDHLHGPASRKRSLNWIKRLEIAEDAAKGIEYLHTGCSPTIIHRDLKSSNILLDEHMRAKVSDFGLSKPVSDGSHVSSIVRGTVGYLDPEYYISQQFTEKSDIYSFGVILLELISGQEPISNENFGANCRNIVQWAKTYIDSGNIKAIIDPSLDNDYNEQSVWKIAEKATMCVKPQGIQRPPMSEVLKDIQEAIAIEQGTEQLGELAIDIFSKHSIGSSVNVDPIDLSLPGRNNSSPEMFMQPGLR
ncbi:hypothetical protein J5N97_006051 [Dioscorea zingiberensis]|uniref:non-specific serine/threonine protein kinase n=1 Tax=Dioscorea zingiberensis TaxID=325984 RepID=A0A9D5D9A7_9LILI|nr:hypothetical protein J5N97_006051 [Dioscorea zingiberensis]